MSVHMCACAHTCGHVCLRVSVCERTCVRVSTCVCACALCARVCTDVRACERTCVCEHVCVRACPRRAVLPVGSFAGTLRPPLPRGGKAKWDRETRSERAPPRRCSWSEGSASPGDERCRAPHGRGSFVPRPLVASGGPRPVPSAPSAGCCWHAVCALTPLRRRRPHGNVAAGVAVRPALPPRRVQAEAPMSAAAGARWPCVVTPGREGVQTGL